LDRLTSVSSSASTTNFLSYDEFGDVTSSQQITAGTTYTFPTYTYNKLGELTSVTYPSGRTLNTAYDIAGRAITVTNQASGLVYASVPTNNGLATGYAPNDMLSSLTLGNTLVESTTFNPRFQPITIQAGSQLNLTLTYGTGSNGTIGDNGNLQSQQIAISGLTNNQTYQYDGVNRLSTFLENGTALQNYSYDAYGNRWIPSGTFIPYSTQTPQSNNFTNNQWAPASNTYDSAGNQTGVFLGTGTRSFTYDAENRQVAASIPGMSAVSYAYDGNGKRVQKTVGTTVTTYVYDAQGNLAAEYGGPGSSVSGTTYLTADHLGSTRLVTNLVNSAINVVERYDYAPFGEELTAGIDGRTTALLFSTNQYPTITPDSGTVKFTGKERDAETGLDNFEARYFSGAQGRFTIPDDPLVDQNPADPQSWNLFAYVRNNPLRNVDPTGQDCITATNQTDRSVTVTVASGNCSGNAANQTYVAGTVDVSSLTYNGTSIGSWRGQTGRNPSPKVAGHHLQSLLQASGLTAVRGALDLVRS